MAGLAFQCAIWVGRRAAVGSADQRQRSAGRRDAAAQAGVVHPDRDAFLASGDAPLGEGRQDAARLGLRPDLRLAPLDLSDELADREPEDAPQQACPH